MIWGGNYLGIMMWGGNYLGIMIWGGNYLGIMIWGETYLGIMMRSHQTRDYMCHAALELRAMYICEEMPAHHAE